MTFGDGKIPVKFTTNRPLVDHFTERVSFRTDISIEHFYYSFILSRQLHIDFTYLVRVLEHIIYVYVFIFALPLLPYSGQRLLNKK